MEEVMAVFRALILLLKWTAFELYPIHNYPNWCLWCKFLPVAKLAADCDESIWCTCMQWITASRRRTTLIQQKLQEVSETL